MRATRKDCIQPDALGTGDLVAFAQGEAEEFVRRHVHACPACRDEAASLKRLQQGLMVPLLRRFCPTTLTLAEYAADSLSPAVRRRISAHLVDCPRCLAESREAARFLAEADRD